MLVCGDDRWVGAEHLALLHPTQYLRAALLKYQGLKHLHVVLHMHMGTWWQVHAAEKCWPDCSPSCTAGRQAKQRPHHHHYHHCHHHHCTSPLRHTISSRPCTGTRLVFSLYCCLACAGELERTTVTVMQTSMPFLDEQLPCQRATAAASSLHADQCVQLSHV